MNSLTELVRDIVQKEEIKINNSTYDSNNNTNVNDTLKCLYPHVKVLAQALRCLWHLNQERAETSTSITNVQHFQQKKYSQILKAVFLINDPEVSNVLRRNGRQYFYLHSLVASAVKFDNTMDANDIRCQILSKFHPKLIKFEFLKAVEEKLINPKNVQDWDYETLKHIVRQGPIYIGP